jgi:hypothetical protein
MSFSSDGIQLRCKHEGRASSLARPSLRHRYYFAGNADARDRIEKAALHLPAWMTAAQNQAKV